VYLPVKDDGSPGRGRGGRSCPRTRRGPPDGGPLAVCPSSPGAPAASQLGRMHDNYLRNVTARRSWRDAAGGKPLASCRSALAQAPRRDGPRVRARGADGGEDGPPRGRRRGSAAAARQRAWRRRQPGRRHAGRSRARSAGPAGDLRLGRTCVRQGNSGVGRNGAEHVFASADRQDLAWECGISVRILQRKLREGSPRGAARVDADPGDRVATWSTSASSRPPERVAT
jgi:hypothetical protein